MENGKVAVVKPQSEARLAILELAHIMSVPTSLNAVLKMKVPEAIWQGGKNTPLSASQILSIVRPNGGGDAENLQRILRLLTTYTIFVEDLSSNGERKYSLTDVGKALVPDDDGLTCASFFVQHHQDPYLRAWPLVGDAVEDPTVEPFEKLHGEAAYAYCTKGPEEMSLFYASMSGMSLPYMREMLENYDGFKGVETLVDVGGNSGVSLNMIMNKYPNILKGINFDLPDMISSAPQYPGITHVGGDALESVPAGDAIFIKWTVLTWTDEEFKKALQSCYKALPVAGKLILCEPVLPEQTDESKRTRALLAADIWIMTMYRTKGKHRTEEEFKQLGISAGFKSFRAFHIDPYLPVLEFHK